MINQLCFLLFLLIFNPIPSYSQTASSVLLAQDNDFDDSVLKDIEDIEVENTNEDEDEEEDDFDEEMDEEEEDDFDEEMDEEEEDDLDEELDEEEEDDFDEELDEEEEDDLDEELDEEEEDDFDEELDEEEEDDFDEELDEEEEDDLDEELDEEEEDDLDEELDEEEEDDLDEELDEEEEDDLDEELDEEEEDDFDEELDEEEEDDFEEDIDKEPDSDITIKPIEEEEIFPGEEESPLEEEAFPGEEESPLEEEALPDEEEPSPEEETLPQEESFDDTSRENLNIIENIRYIAAEDRIVIDSSEVISYQVRHNRKNNQIIIEILQARLVENLQWPYILKDFNTGFGMIQADAKDSSTVRILIQVKENYPMPLIILGEKGDQMIATFQGVSSFRQTPKVADSADTKGILPAQTLEDFYFGKLDFSGHPLSFHVIDAPIKQVLRFISEESGLNMVIDESVTGSVTMKLENIPWDQAFHTILKVKDLGYIGQGNVVMISSLSALQAKTSKVKDLVESTKALSPFQTKVIPVSYGKISDIVSKIKPFLTKTGKTGGKTGEVIIHEESGTLVVIDTEKTIKRIEQLVSFLDKPPKQVMIEARIVDAVETFTEDFGLSWNMTGNLPLTINLRRFADIFRTPVISDNGRQANLNLYGVPLIGNIGATLRLAETKGLARVISSPKIVTISGKAASINRNSPILIPKSVTTNTTENLGVQNETLESIDIQIGLTVTPHVTPSGSVFMQVQITRSSPGPKAGERGQATSTQRSAQTQVLVKNGHTVVIGGIYQYDEIISDGGLPFLRHIPFLKFLFGKSGFETSKSELLVFLTPKLIDPINN